MLIICWVLLSSTRTLLTTNINAEIYKKGYKGTPTEIKWKATIDKGSKKDYLDLLEELVYH
jgi:ribosomal protein L31E